ncbi:MAG: SDR family oxidoreductase [Alphaproteobacteria bacterium]|nr:SDR family oxidoreductase [Alphaproteobacteria bacterium]MBU1516594.1 SDR family oxidoreductase [Alphaproteobacteria bacterium]MBU2094351.1 SDR family oxidoreductase [Alphaproteobacteria bacterium]MBU2153235.1 SDR family oxidoreductase [Alphaproteobacteria bacterium]MBU2307521.1 SDR family oxidoreductase [Alphaproteobacteria bacterium]
MKIVVIGGTGRIGSRLVGSLKGLGHDAIPAAPETGVNTLTGEGLSEVLAGAQVVVDLANSPSFADDAVMAFFQTAGRNLLAAEAAAGVKHHVALSIVGADQLPASGYMRAKVAQEDLIKAGPIPYSLIRSTQFLPFIGGIVDSAVVDGQIPLSPALMQPIHPDDVVAELVAVAPGEPLNRTIEIGGPEALPITAFAEAYLRAKADTRRVVADPAAPYFGAVLEERSLTPGPGARLGTITLADWLRESIPAA